MFMLHQFLVFVKESGLLNDSCRKIVRNILSQKLQRMLCASVDNVPIHRYHSFS